MRALRRDPTAADTLPAGRARAAGLPERRDARSRASTRSRARHRTSRSTSSARRCSAPSSRPRSACPTRSRRTSRRSALQDAVARLPRALPAVRAARAPVRDRGRQRARGRHRGGGAASSCELRRRTLVRGALQPPGQRADRRGGRGVLRSPQGMHVDQMLTYTALGTPDAVSATSRTSRARRRRRADRRPPGRHDRGAPAVARAGRRDDRAPPGAYRPAYGTRRKRTVLASLPVWTHCACV